MKKIPNIDAVMSASPHTVNLTMSVQKAFDLMREYRVRHLPVLDGGKLVGIISDRDVHLASSFSEDLSKETTVEDIMVTDPYTCSPETPLDKVCEEMSKNKYGCAIVHKPNGQVLGVFTATDALVLLAKELRRG